LDESTKTDLIFSKSQLAIEYSYRRTESVRDLWIFWIHAGTRARVEEGFKSIADTVKLRGRNDTKADVPQLVHNWLRNEQNGKWVIIIDSADDTGVFFNTGNRHTENLRDGKKALSAYLPQSPNGSILVTTRNKDLAFRLTGDHQSIIEVGPMNPADAFSLLEMKLDGQTDPDAGTELVKTLEYMPLAISQAGAYIRQGAPRTSVKKYLDEFRRSERKKSNLLNYDAGDLRRDPEASNSVIITWQISFDQIRSETPSATELLSLMSFFDCQGISESLIRPVSHGETIKDGEDNDDDESTIFCDSTNEEFERSIIKLRDYSLVTTNEAGDLFEMHRLVQLATRTWLAANGELEAFKRQFISRLAEEYPPAEFENWERCRKLFAHAEVAMTHRPIDNESLKEWASLLHYSGWYALNQGKYTIAAKMLEASKATKRKIFGENNEPVLRVTLLLCKLLRHRGLYKQAESLSAQVTKTSSSVLGAEHLCTLSSMAELSVAYYYQGQYKEAETLGLQVMETRKVVLNAEHPDALTSMIDLARIYNHQGRYKKAEALFLQVIETRKMVLGIEHPNTLTSIGNLAETYQYQGRYNVAETLELQVMETRKTVLGAEHPDTLASMDNLASTYWRQGRYNEAETLELQVMETRKTVLGAEHPDTLVSMGNLGLIYWRQGRYNEAETLELQVIETRKTVLGAEYPNTLASMGNLGLTYWRQGRYNEAETLELQVRETRTTVLGAEHPDTLSSMYNLACLYNSQGLVVDAVELMKQCVRAYIRVLGPEHPDTLISLSVLNGWYVE
jgi:tetratricopeptide (TPR) repeat protein